MTRYILPEIRYILANRYVQWGTLAEAMSLSLVSGVPLALTGPGGRGKSYMTDDILKAIDPNAYIKGLGTGTTEADLLGGVVAVTQRVDDKEITKADYDLSKSFIKSSVVKLEEAFDAPARVLTLLKDWLSSGCYRDGDLQVPLSTEVLVLCSNRNTSDLAELGPDVEALLQRFLLVKIDWDDYSKDSYLELFKTSQANKPLVDRTISLDHIRALRAKANKITVSSQVTEMLSTLMSDLAEKGIVLSARLAVRALHLIKSAAVIDGADEATLDHVSAIRYIDTSLDLCDSVREYVHKEQVKSRIITELNEIEEVYKQARNFFSKIDSKTLAEKVDMYKRVKDQGLDKLTRVSVTDEYHQSLRPFFPKDTCNPRTNPNQRP